MELPRSIDFPLQLNTAVRAIILCRTDFMLFSLVWDEIFFPVCQFNRDTNLAIIVSEVRKNDINSWSRLMQFI